MSKRIVGLICAWACEDLIAPCIEQSLEQSDDTLVCIAPHSRNMEQFEDKTFDIASSYSGIKLFKSDGRSYHASQKANILNSMLKSSEYFEVGNWWHIRDCDEFFTQDTYKKVRQVIEEDKYNAIRMPEKYFYINMQHYLKNYRCRLRKIEDKKQRFFPTQQWPFSKNEVILEDCCMFHYGMMPNPWAKMEFWKSEYQGTQQNIKVDWIDKIYRNYNLNNEEYWIKENEKLFGIKSPWFSDDFKPQEDGTLFKYNGEHPKYVRHLEEIKDFRLIYNFIRV